MSDESGRPRRVRRLTPASQFDAGQVKSMLSQQISNCARLDSAISENEYGRHGQQSSTPSTDVSLPLKESADEDALGKSVGDCSPFHRQALITNATKRSSLRRRSTKDSGYGGDLMNSGDDDEDEMNAAKMQPITERHFSRGGSISSDCDDEAMESGSSDCGSIENSPYTTRRRRVTPVPLSASKMKEALQLQFRGSSECMFVEEEDVEDVAQFNSDDDYVGRAINMNSRRKKRGCVKSSSFDCLRLALAKATRQMGANKQRLTSLSFDERRGCVTDEDDDRTDDVCFRPLQTRSLDCSPIMTRNGSFPKEPFKNNNSDKGLRHSNVSSSDDECFPSGKQDFSSADESSDNNVDLPRWMMEAQASIDEASQSESDLHSHGNERIAERAIISSNPISVRKNEESKTRTRRKVQSDPPRLMSQGSKDDSDDPEENFILRLKRTANRKKQPRTRKLTPSSTKPLNLDKLHSLRDHLSKCTLSEE